MMRSILASIEFSGQKCMDVGTQEALIPVLMHRQGASSVDAYDRLNLTDRVSLVQQAYDVSINYHHSLQLNELPDVVYGNHQAPYDVVGLAGSSIT